MAIQAFKFKGPKGHHLRSARGQRSSYHESFKVQKVQQYAIMNARSK